MQKFVTIINEMQISQCIRVVRMKILVSSNIHKTSLYFCIYSTL